MRRDLYVRLLSSIEKTAEAVVAEPEQIVCVASLDSLCSAQPKLMTMIYVLRNSTREVLLGHKARGFGAGNWNAFGGKVEHGTDASIAASAARELHEESGLSLPNGPQDLQPVGVILFRYPNSPAPKEYLEVHVFTVDADNVPLQGTITESEEMHPIRWFQFDHVPLDKMWKDDEFWLKRMLAGCSEASRRKTDAAGELSYRMVAFFQFHEMDAIHYLSIIDGFDPWLSSCVDALQTEYCTSSSLVCAGAATV